MTFNEERAVLLEQAEALQRLLPAAEARLIDRQILDDLRENRFDVAVLGQIKAGKSTFLGALIERSGLLPTDPNPWTAVITRLHFGKPGGPTQGGVFSFYSREEWSQLNAPVAAESADSARTADARQLEIQRRELVNRVRQRFGPELDRLLGMQHEVQELSRETLQAYLASGKSSLATPGAGRYADITREAELFFPQRPFLEYCSYVDTPGLDDPCLLREAKTLQYIGRAHAYVLILSSVTASSGANLEMVRNLLLGLHKERLVVFVNRLDNLANPATDSDSVVSNYKDLLRTHFPNHDLPIVVAGSAYWAHLALERDPRLLSGLAYQPGFTDFGIARGMFTEADVQTWQTKPRQHLDAIAQAAWRCSGLPDIRAAVTDVLLRGKGSYLLQVTRRALGNAAEGFACQRDDRASRCDQDRLAMEQRLAEQRQQAARLAEMVRGLKQQQAEVGQTQNEAREELTCAIRKGSQAICKSLGELIETFAGSEARKLEQDGISWFQRYFASSLTQCRAEMEQRFLTSYRSIRGKVLRKQREHRDQLRQQLQAIDPGLARAVDIVPPGTIDTPPLTTIRAQVSVDRGGFWDRLFEDQGDRKKKAIRLRKDIEEAFREAIDTLVEQARECLDASVAATLDHFDSVLAQAFSALEQQLQERQQQFQKLAESSNDANAQAIIAARRTEADEMRTQAGRIREVGAAVAAERTDRSDSTFGATEEAP